jgi:hypothetical protein
MLRDGGNADEENQDADDVGLEPQDRIGVHGERSEDGLSSRFPREGVPRVRTQARQPSHRHSFRAVFVSAPSTEISDVALTALGWRLAPASAARANPVVRKASQSRSLDFVRGAIAPHDR